MKYLSKKIAFAYLTQNDDILYKKKEFYKLSILAEEIVADNFNLFPQLDGLDEIQKNKIYELLEFKYPIDLWTNNIENENFWKRMYTEYFNSKLLEKISYSWKSTFLERYLENYLKNFDINKNHDFKNIINSFQKFIFNLNIKETSLDIDFHYLFVNLINIENLTVIFGNKKEENVINSINGINLNVANMLSDSLLNLKNLKQLKLYGNNIDDEILKIIVDSIKLNSKLELIDLSHNRISDNGLRILSNFLSKNSSIKILNLSHNEISYEGMIFFSCIFNKNIEGIKFFNTNIEDINLKLNFINDKSLETFLENIKDNQSIKKLNVSANLLTDESSNIICDYIKNNKYIKELYLDCNQFTDASFTIFENALSINDSLIKFSIEKNNLSLENKDNLQNYILEKYLLLQNIPFINQGENKLDLLEKQINNDPDLNKDINKN